MCWTDDPARDWDVYCDMQERAYKALIQGKKCRDCGHCLESPDEETTYWYCDDVADYVPIDDSVEEIGCESFKE